MAVDKRLETTQRNPGLPAAARLLLNLLQAHIGIHIHYQSLMIHQHRVQLQ